MALNPARLDAARQVLREERRRTVDEREAFRSFRDELRSTTATPPSTTAMGVTSLARSQTTDKSLARVRRSYERTVMSVPHYDDEYADTFEDSITAEFGPGVAAALQSASCFSPGLRQTLTAAAETAVRERDEFIDVLDVESNSIESMSVGISSVHATLVSLDETPLPEQTFDELRALYEDVSALGAELESLAATRQRTLVHHRRALSSMVPDVTEYLYGDLSVRYPVLATLAEAAETLDTAMRCVERHLASTP